MCNWCRRGVGSTEKGAVLFFFQLIVAVMKIPLGHGAVMKRRYISVAFGLSAALALLDSNVILFIGIVPKRNCIKRGSNRPCRSIVIGYSIIIISFWRSSLIAWSSSCFAPVTVSNFCGRINFFLSLTCKCALAAAVTVSIMQTESFRQIYWDDLITIDEAFLYWEFGNSGFDLDCQCWIYLCQLGYDGFPVCRCEDARLEHIQVKDEWSC